MVVPVKMRDPEGGGLGSQTRGGGGRGSRSPGPGVQSLSGPATLSSTRLVPAAPSPRIRARHEALYDPRAVARGLGSGGAVEKPYFLIVVKT